MRRVAEPDRLDDVFQRQIDEADELLGFELPDRVVRAGGYNTIDQVIGQLLPCIEKEWQKRMGGTA